MNRFACSSVMLFALLSVWGCATKPAGEGEAGADAPGGAGAPEGAGLERLLPAGTLVYFSIEDLRRTKERMADTSVKRLLDDPEIEAFLAKPLSKLREVMEEAEIEGDFEFDDLFAAFGGQTVVALTELGPGTQRGPKVGAVALADVTDAGAAGRLFDILMEEIGPKRPDDPEVSLLTAPGWRGVRIAIGREDEPFATVGMTEAVLMVAVHPKDDATVAAILARQPIENPLPSAERFREMTAKLSPNRVYTFYALMDDLRDAILAIARDQEGEDTGLAQKVIEALGVEGELAASAGLSVTPPGMTHKLYVKAPRPRRGIFAVMPDDDLTDATRRMATDDMEVFAAFRFDLSALMFVVKEIVELSGRGPQLQQGLDQARAMLGIDVQLDLLGSMGSQVIVASFPGGSSPMPLLTPYVNLALAIDLEDTAKFNGIVTKLLGMGDMLLKAQGKEGLRETKVGEVAMRSVDIEGVISPCIAVTDSHVIIAGGHVAARRLIRLASGHNPAAVVDTDRFKELAERVGGLDGPEMIYSGTVAARAAMAAGLDPEEEVRKALSQLPPELVADIEEWVDWSKLPRGTQADRYFMDQLDVVHANDDGLLFVGYGLVGGSGTPMMLAGAGGVAAGLTLPALATAREKARRVKCMSNLKQIGIGLHVYSTDNNDAFPKTLKALMPKYVMDREMFECPTKPGMFAYGYVSGPTSAGRPTWVIAFDRDENHDFEGRNVLFLDGHVEWMSEGGFQTALRKTLDEARAKGIEPRVLLGAEPLDVGPLEEDAPADEDVEELF